MARLRLILTLILAAAVSLGAGFGMSWLVGQMHCEGEQLACNIDDAIGAYAIFKWAALGLVAFGIALLFANKRVALIGATIVLIVPLLVFVGGDLIEGWRYVGLYLYADFRSCISKFAPPGFVVLVQYFILRFAVDRLMG